MGPDKSLTAVGTSLVHNRIIQRAVKKTFSTAWLD